VDVSLGWLSNEHRELTSSGLDLVRNRSGNNGLFDLGLLSLDFSRGSLGGSGLRDSCNLWDGSSLGNGGLDSLGGGNRLSRNG
jgi:hypothetical protein